MGDYRSCNVCGDSEPFHVHNEDHRIDDYFTVGRGMTDFSAAQAWKERCLAAERRLVAIRALVDQQVEDEGLWALPLVEGTQPIVEAYLQQELRRLHAVVEGDYP